MGIFFCTGLIGAIMHIYWRINQDLETLGQSIVFHDPRFIRCFKQWINKNLIAITVMEQDFLSELILPSAN